MRARLGAFLLAVLVLASACSGGGSKKASIPSIVTVVGAGLGAPFVASGMAVDKTGHLLLSDSNANRVMRLESDNRLVPFAGSGTDGFSGDGGDAKAARLSGPGPLAVDANGDLFIADVNNNRIRKVDPRGRITTIAGDGLFNVPVEGALATDSSVPGISAIASDQRGNVFVASTTQNTVIRIGTDGHLRTVAGGGPPLPGLVDYVADATQVDIGAPDGLAVDSKGNVYISETTENRVLKLAPDGKLAVAAGARLRPPPVDRTKDTPPPAVVTEVPEPSAVAVGRGDELVLGDDVRDKDNKELGRVRTISTTGVVHTLAQGDQTPDEYRAPARSAPVLSAGINGPPTGLAVTAKGDIYVGDAGRGRVRVLSGKAATGYLVNPEYYTRPAVQKVVPDHGGDKGGTTLVITGQGFVPDKTTVSLGGKKVPVRRFLETGTQLESDTVLEVTTPPGKVGTGFDVTVTTPGGTSRRTNATHFNYVAGWDYAAPLATARLDHRATLLDPLACHVADPPAGYPCGQVLVTGGLDGFCITCPSYNSAELYDPATGKWRSAAPMLQGRMEHTQTLLDDGRVLVAGGKFGGDPNNYNVPTGIQSAEIYDPRADAWSSTGNMAEGRLGHTATLLDGGPCRTSTPPAWCGRVLVVGGANREFNRPPIASAELWDPSSGQWSPAGKIDGARANHTASLLPDGRVLVAGGFGTNTPASNPDENISETVFSSVEVYDPTANSWSPGPNMAYLRMGHTATTLANGEVLVVGGSSAVGDNPQYLKTAEIYDPATSSWRIAGIPLEARSGHIAALLPGGRVLVAGGGPNFEHASFRHDSIASTEIYDPATQSWTETRVLNTQRTVATATVLDGPACRTSGPHPLYCGAVLVVGGGATTGDPSAQNSPTVQSSVEIYR